MGAIRLTTLSHGGGCGCKIAPAVLDELLAKLPRSVSHPELLVGIETGDDAAVYRIDDRRAVVATTDFFMPIVDDAYDFGRIAATNALSDVYAVGGRPIFALAIVGMPMDRLPVAIVQEVLAGGAAACDAAGIVIAGGHTIDAPEPIYGLAAVGLVDPDCIKRNNGALPGDVLILGKPLGIGILGAAVQKGEIDDDGYAQMVTTATRLNAVGAEFGAIAGVHAMTDVTGFGLLGHLLEMCRGAGLAARIEATAVPLLPAARTLALAGVNTGAAGRNWTSFGAQVTLPAELPGWCFNLLCDPQTSGGLLVACDPAEAERVLALFRADGHEDAAAIGTMERGEAGIVVR